jgi:sulfoxide reductase heme-binding subunit YedZ
MSSTSVAQPAGPRARHGFEGPRIVYVAIVGFGLMCGVGFLAEASTEQAVRLAIRETARTTLVLFVVLFCTSAIRRRWPTPATHYLMRNRRYLGLAAATSHAYHLLFILALYGMGAVGDETSLVTVIGGGWGFVLLAAMAATSNDASQRALRKNWRQLHVLGMWTVWIIYAASYFPAATVTPIAFAGSVVLLCSLALRLWPKPKTHS